MEKPLPARAIPWPSPGAPGKKLPPRRKGREVSSGNALRSSRLRGNSASALGSRSARPAGAPTAARPAPNPMVAAGGGRPRGVRAVHRVQPEDGGQPRTRRRAQRAGRHRRSCGAGEAPGGGRQVGSVGRVRDVGRGGGRRHPLGPHVRLVPAPNLYHQEDGDLAGRFTRDVEAAIRVLTAAGGSGTSRGAVEPRKTPCRERFDASGGRPPRRQPGLGQAALPIGVAMPPRRE